jgi:hypothetical protein
LVDNITGKTHNWKKPESIKILADVLETDYNELFDMKFNSPLYAGLKLDSTAKVAEPLKASELTILTPSDRPTGPFNTIKKLGDLKAIGVECPDSLEVKEATIQHGRLQLVVPAPTALYKKLTNTALTKNIFDLVIPKEILPLLTWKGLGDFFKDVTEFNDPIQGAVANCYFIAALSAVAWADLYNIIHHTRATGPGDTDSINGIQFYNKSGGSGAPTSMVEVTDKVPVDANNQPIYCRDNDKGEIWPEVYEKAYAKWKTQNTMDFPNITLIAFGDTVLVTAQITNKTPYYYNTATLTPQEIFTIVTSNSLSFKTINPMTAWTPASGPPFFGSNIVANHAYTILGWANNDGKDYLVLRNPWGRTEPAGVNTINGLVSFFDESFWRVISTIPDDGIFALEVDVFKTFYAGLGVAK